MHTVFALLCFVVVIHWLIFPYPSGLLHWHCGNLTIVPVPAKQPWWIWIYTSCEFIMKDCITTTKQSTTQPCAYFLGYTVPSVSCQNASGTLPPGYNIRNLFLCAYLFWSNVNFNLIHCSTKAWLCNMTINCRLNYMHWIKKIIERNERWTNCLTIAWRYL